MGGLEGLVEEDPPTLSPQPYTRHERERGKETARVSEKWRERERGRKRERARTRGRAIHVVLSVSSKNVESLYTETRVVPGR